MAFHLFHNNQKVAKVDSTLMIELTTTSTSKHNQKPSFDLALTRWDTHVGANQLNGMKYYINKPSKKRTRAYFSPYTLDCFLKYLGKLINNNTVIPHSNGQTLDGFAVDTILIDNIIARNKNGKILLDKNQHILIHGTSKIREYKRVPYNNNFCYASVIIFHLLFFSYNQEQLDNLGSKIRSTYKYNKSVANEFKQIYFGEYKVIHHGKDLPDGDFAKIPSYKSFTDMNKDAVYIPNLTTDKQKQYVKNKLKNNNINIYDLGQSNSKNRLAVLKTAMAWKEMHEKDVRVGKLVNSDKNKKRQEDKLAAEKSAESEKAVEKSAAQWRASTAKDAKSEFASNRANSSKSETLDDVTNSESAYEAKEASVTASLKNASEDKEDSSASESNSDSDSETSSEIASASKSISMSVPKAPDQVGSVSSESSATSAVGNIDYSSIKEPFILTNDPNVLAQAVKSMISDKKLDINKPVHFTLLDVDKDLPAPESPEVAIKTKHLDNQRYVQEEANEFKKIANSFIKHEEYNLNLIERQHRLNTVEKAYDLLATKVQQVVNQYSDDSSLESSAAHYYKMTYHRALINLQHSRDTELTNIKKALSEEFRGRFNQAQANIYRKFDKEQQHLENLLNNNTVKVYNNSRSKRIDAMHKSIRQTKKDAKHTLHVQLEKYHMKFEKKASEANKLLYSFFNRQLKKNKKTWISTVAKMIEAQIKSDNSRAKLKQLALKAANHKHSPAEQAKLSEEIKETRQYADESERKLRDSKSHLLDIKQQLMDTADENDDLKDRIDNLKASVESANNSSKRNIDNEKKIIARLRKQLDEHDNQDINYSNNITNMQRQSTENSLALNRAKDSLDTTKMEASQYQKMLSEQRAQTNKEYAKYAELQQKFFNFSLNAQNNGFSAQASSVAGNTSKANSEKSASIAKSVSASFASSVSTQDSLQRQSLNDKKLSLSVQQSLAQSTVAQDQLRNQLLRKSLKSSASQQASLDSAHNRSVSTSISEHQSIEASEVKSSTIAKYQASVSAQQSKADSRSAEQSYAASISFAVSQSASESLVESSKSSAQQAVADARSEQAKSIKATKAHTKARSEVTAKAKSSVAAAKASSKEVDSQAASAKQSISQSKRSQSIAAASASKSASKAQASKVSSTESSITASLSASTSISLSEFKSSVRASQSASAKSEKAKIATTQVDNMMPNNNSEVANQKSQPSSKSPQNSKNAQSANEQSHQQALHGNVYTPNVSTSERLHQIQQNALQQKINKINADIKNKKNHGHRHKHFWQA